MNRHFQRIGIVLALALVCLPVSAHELLHIGGMQAGGRLVKNIERVAALCSLQLGGQLDSLRLTTR